MRPQSSRLSIARCFAPHAPEVLGPSRVHSLAPLPLSQPPLRTAPSSSPHPLYSRSSGYALLARSPGYALLARSALAVHFAGLKAVGESVAIPLKYYHGNITSSIYLIELLSKYGCKKIVFSSSATVYGMAEPPISEQTPAGVGLTNPYGRTKYFLEEIFRDVYKSDNEWGIVLLRYFNPAGAHPSGRIGEDPNGIPNNLMPYVQQVAVGRREFLTVFGDDYPTPDGTGVRDFIHVDDLAAGHLAAIGRLEAEETKSGCYTYNLGTGKGYSVLEMVKAMEVAAAKEIPYKVGPRREGDIASVYATPDKAKEELGWEAKKGLQEMCADAWRWQSENPTGYPKPDEGKA